ncbi:TPA: o-succinylbenzoate synthase, partial [Bacillus cereus]|nr:o-succinylbenzoate synthase [Bacillus cereus]
DIIWPEVMLEGGKVMVPQSVDAEYEVDRGRLEEITKQRIVFER